MNKLFFVRDECRRQRKKLLREMSAAGYRFWATIGSVLKGI